MLNFNFTIVNSNKKLFFLQSEHFSFLGTNVAISEMRFRSMFYTSLGRLLMVDLGEDEERFYNFMMPLTSKWNKSLYLNLSEFISQIHLNRLPHLWSIQTVAIPVKMRRKL